MARGENWFDNHFHARRNNFLGPNSESFVWNGDDFPVDVLFSTLVFSAPVDVTLAISSAGPVSRLTFFGAVSPLLATPTQLESMKIEAVGAVSGNSIYFFL